MVTEKDMAHRLVTTFEKTDWLGGKSNAYVQYLWLVNDTNKKHVLLKERDLHWLQILTVALPLM